MTIKITTPNGGSDSLDFGCAQTLNVAAVTGTEVSSGEGKLELKTTTGGTSATKATILANGNVGIGTTAPAKKLNVSSSAEIARFDGTAAANDHTISIKNNSQTANTSTNIFFADRHGASSYASSYIRGTASGTSVLSFATGGTNFTNIYDSGAPTVKMTINSAGALTLASPALSNLAITKSTTQATTSGTAFDFGSIPSGVNRVCVMFRGVSLSSSAHHLIQLSTGGTVLTSGYVSSSYWGGGGESATNGMVWYGGNNAARVISGIMTLQHMGGNIWVNSHAGKYTAPTCSWGGGDVDLGGVLDGIRVTNDATGSNTYDAGAINISWEF